MGNREKRVATACGVCAVASVVCFAVFAFQYSGWLVASIAFAFATTVIIAANSES